MLRQCTPRRFSPLDVYHRSRTRFTAGFLGSPRENFIADEVAEITDADAAVELTGGVTITAMVASEPPRERATERVFRAELRAPRPRISSGSCRRRRAQRRCASVRVVLRPTHSGMIPSCHPSLHRRPEP